jgi:hypothetical protein
MRAVTVAVVLTMWLGVDVGWLFFAVGYIWPSDNDASPVWARFVVLLAPIPICYVAAFVCWVILALIERVTFRVLELWSDLLYIFSLPHWLERNLGKVLIFSPVLVFAAATLVCKAASFVPTHSSIVVHLTVENSGEGPEQYDFIHPLLFPLDETTTVSIEHRPGTQRRISCSLSVQELEVEPVTLGNDGGRLLTDGNASPVPDCLWLATAHRSGSQKAILKVSFLPPNAQDARTDLAEAPKEVVDIESFHVAGGLFTAQSLFVVVMLAGVFAGLLRLRKEAGKTKDTEATREPRKVRTPRMKIEIESKLYDGETKTK